MGSYRWRSRDDQGVLELSKEVGFRAPSLYTPSLFIHTKGNQFTIIPNFPRVGKGGIERQTACEPNHIYRVPYLSNF